ncbi:TIGR02611 family protein [Microbispora sp. H11081]|uniref:TIGR02611 family protein n=1 Tax=Microbispora sp. H11081 TaxID=2729107 RepID=UPI002896BB44|nr:TIGR02611 family protein [Microbispora sp. H11081]
MATAEDSRFGGERRASGPRGLLDRIRATPAGRLTLRIVIGVIGTALVITGLIMVPFPGPGWLVVFAGLAVLATEFTWASRLLEFAKDKVRAATDWLKRQNWFVRIVASALTLLCAGAIVWVSVRLTLGVDLIQEARELLS